MLSVFRHVGRNTISDLFGRPRPSWLPICAKPARRAVNDSLIKPSAFRLAQRHCCTMRKPARRQPPPVRPMSCAAPSPRMAETVRLTGCPRPIARTCGNRGSAKLSAVPVRTMSAASGLSHPPQAGHCRKPRPHWRPVPFAHESVRYAESGVYPLSVRYVGHCTTLSVFQHRPATTFRSASGGRQPYLRFPKPVCALVTIATRLSTTGPSLRHHAVQYTAGGAVPSPPCPARPAEPLSRLRALWTVPVPPRPASALLTNRNLVASGSRVQHKTMKRIKITTS